MIRGNNEGEATNPPTTSPSPVVVTSSTDHIAATNIQTNLPLARTQNVNVVSVLPPNRVLVGGTGGGGGPQYVTTNQQFLAVSSSPGSVTGTLRPNQATSVHPLSLPHPQQQHQALYTVGTSSNLARILASTHGYVQVRYGSPVATVASGMQPQTVSVSSIRSPVANVIATTMGISKTPIVSSNPIDNTRIGSPSQIGSAPTVVTWMRPSTPTTPSSSVNRLLPQRLTFNREQQTVRWPIVTTTTAAAATTVVVPSPATVAPSAAVRSVMNRHKRVKLEGTEDPSPPDVIELRRSIVEYRTVEATTCKQSYLDHMSELFFLQNGLNIMDYLTWKKRSNPQLMAYLRANALDSEDEEQNGALPSSLLSSSVVVTTATTTPGANSKSFSEVKVPISGGTPVATCTTLPAAVVQQGKYHVPGKPQGGRHGMVFGNYQPSLSQTKTFHPSFTPGGTSLASNFSTVSSSQTSISASFTTAVSTKSQTSFVPGTNNEPRVATRILPSTPTTPVVSTNVVHTVVSSSSLSSSSQKTSTTVAVSSHGNASPLKTPRAASFSSGTPARLQTRQHSISAVYDSTLGSQEEIVERAKQEAYVMQKVSDLRKEGLWSERRLPKVQEPPRTKAHWDYLLEEMIWLATDFSQERKWKKATAKKCARMCHKFQEEQKLREERAEKDAEQKLKRIASVVAKEIKQFWANVEKLVEYKQQSRLEEKRKRALDHQLNFIVDQTEKYSSWLAQGMNKSVNEDGQANAMSSSLLSRSSSPGNFVDSASDGDFEPASDDSDDEETIAKEEEELGVDVEAQKVELDLLQKEGEAPLEDILKNLPPEILERPASSLVSEEEGGDGDEEEDVDVAGPSSSLKNVGDNEFHVSSNETSSDDESTMEEQEALEREVDHARELEELKDEGEMTIEELADKYCAAYDSDFQMEGSDSSDESSDNDDEEVDDSDYEESSDESEDEEDVDMGLESLVDPVKKIDSNETNVESDGPGNEITDIVATAESLKPKGYTYQTTQVATKVPFLLKHQLREYQHIGLDWLVTMYERKLNGILADEMGLGKTIQTIALLAHLACEKGIWGPHLIVVPTSVMLNWEMEIKKWCPAFKILTYYGNVKERKLKRQGWTKPNTFHVCITSYKLVIQDHQSFRRKKWKYFILDEAQNIKNFKSQRWQLLLNFQSQRRLLLTGTPLQNSLMELWSLMHFLMPNVFHSHRDFKEWFANPVSGMIEGSHDYNRELISRLHKVLRPFILRRLKSEVEKQLPSKYEHVVMCRLSKRQRFLYDDFMSQAKTKETLSSGSFMSVINVLMQLRKVCNHPNLFESRPTISPFRMPTINYETSSLCTKALEYDPFKVVDLFSLNLLLADLELCLTAFAAHRIKKFQAPKKLIEEIDSSPAIPPKCPPGKIKLHVRTTSSTAAQKSAAASVQPVANSVVTTPSTSTPPVANVAGVQIKTVLPCPPPATLASATPVSLSSGYTIVTVPAAVRTIAPTAITTSALGHHTGYTLQLVQQPSSNQVTLASVQSGSSPVVASAPITVQIQQTQHGPRLTVPSGQLAQIPSGFAQLVQTSTGQHILLTSNSPQTVLKPVNAVHSTSTIGQATTSAARLTVTLSTSAGRPVTAAVEHPVVSQPRVSAPLSVLSATTTTSAVLSAVSKPIGRVQPLNVVTVSSPASSSVVTTSKPVVSQPVKMVTRAAVKVEEGPKDSKTSSRSNVKSLFCLEEVIERRRKHKRERLERLAKFNTRRCEACPIYGSDLIKAVTVVDDTDPVGPAWRGMGYVHCLKATSLSSHPKHYWNQTEALGAAVSTPESLLRRLHDILSRFVFLVPPVLAPDVTMHVSHPSPSRFQEDCSRAAFLRSELSQRVASLHPIASAMATQFPDPRLIQYDCGKLQTLDRLLRSLKNDGRRVLIFTQMTRMLDVLEQFLNYHGHIYLRLDGTTRVEQRQALMERFNADRRIFCFILSTRSGGIGVNLTGADTVIFYDSDWNPTMDAQAQDRCHRIGQTRDVHIYRLISERTVEENILKKANQKRLLGEVAIEGGNFTTAFFKKHTIKELFEMDFGAPKKEALVSVIKHEPKDEEVATSSDAMDVLSTTQFEHALANAEEDTDVLAAKTAKAEAAAELAEFDESISYDGDSRGDDDSSKVEDELGSLISQLTPIERYAMTFLESTQEPFSLEQLKQAEDEIEAQKKDWELGRLQALKEEEERRASLEDNDIPYTYSREDAYNQIYISPNTGEQMPVWAPPTPPQDDSDFYVDYSVCFLYEPNIMTEAQLPPVYVKKEHKRARTDPSTIVRKQKLVRKDDSVFIPRSLFDRPTAAVLKMRRDVKSQKSRPTVKLTSGYKPPTIVNKPIVDTHQDSPEWLIHEDWALFQAVQGLLELPLNLIVLSPAHTPNWDLVADVVNATSRMYRSAKQCKSRYESVVIPREEGKILYDTNPKKQKKSKGIYRTKNNRPMRTSQLFTQDNNMSFTHLYHQRFETIKSISNKRMPTLKPMLVNTSIRNPKHAAVLAETGINNEQPLTPVQVAINRADRIAREKLKTQVLTNEQLVQRQPQPQVQPASPQVQATTPTHSPATGGGAQSIIGLSPGGITAQQLQNVIGRMTVASPGIATAVAATSPPVIPGSIRTQRGGAQALLMQEVVGGVTQVRGLASPVAPTVVSMANLVASQVQTAVGTPQGVNAAGITSFVTGSVSAQSVTSPQLPGKVLTASQIQQFRTQSLYKQQQQQQQQRLQQVAQQQIQSPKVPLAVTSLLSPGVATVQVAQAQQQQRFQPVKQGVPRAMTEAEVAQLIRRQQLLHQQKAAAVAAAQVTQVQVPAQGQLSSQLLAQAQLQHQQQQSASAATGQTPLATLVKTVSTPTSLGGATSSVTIPVGTVGMTGVNINVSLPQVKAAIGTAKGTIVTQQQQLQQVKLQQQLQQRKLQQLQQQQQKAAHLAHVQGKGQLGTVQIMQQAAAAQNAHKALPAGVTVQQLQQVIKQVQPQALQHLTQVSAAGTTIMAQATVVSQAQIQQALSHSVLAKSASISTTAGHTASTLGQATVHARLIPVSQTMAAAGISTNTLGQQHQQHAMASGTLKQTIQVVTATTPTQLIQSQIRTQAAVGTASSNMVDVSGRQQTMVGHAAPVVATTVTTMTLPPGMKVVSSAGQQTQTTQVTLGVPQVGNLGGQPQPPTGGSGR